MNRQKRLMRILAGMLVVAAVLAVASLATVWPVRADPWAPPDEPQPMGCPRTECTEWHKGPCGSCMGYHGQQWVRWCRVCDPCFGICTPYRLNTLCNPCR